MDEPAATHDRRLLINPDVPAVPPGAEIEHQPEGSGNRE